MTAKTKKVFKDIAISLLICVLAMACGTFITMLFRVIEILCGLWVMLGVAFLAMAIFVFLLIRNHDENTDNGKQDKDSFYKQCGVDESKFVPCGDLNYIVEAFISENENGKVELSYTDYMPRKESLYHGYNDISKEELFAQMADTKERMKMAIVLIDKFIAGEINYFYYWDESSLQFRNQIYMEE